MQDADYPTRHRAQAANNEDGWYGATGLTRGQQRAEIARWYGTMVECYEAMSPEERADVDRWDAEMVDGSGDHGTSDWPGWAERIGRHPLKGDPSPLAPLADALQVTVEILELIAAGEIEGFLAANAGGGMVFLSSVGALHPPTRPFSRSDWAATVQAAIREKPRNDAWTRPPKRPAPKSEQPRTIFSLYRLYDEAGRLLYVGITRSLKNRLAAHRRKWGDLIADVKTEEYDDLASLMEAERAAIRDERPSLNVDGIDEL